MKKILVATICLLMLGLWDLLPGQTPSGFIVMGETDSYELPLWTQILIYRLDMSGNKLWRKVYGSSLRDRHGWIEQTTDGGFVMTSTDESTDDQNLQVFKLDAAGNVSWHKDYGGYIDDRGFSIKQTADGGYIAFGDTMSYVHGTEMSDTDFLAYRLDAAGSKLWRKNYGGTSYDTGRSVGLTADGGFIMGGYTYSYTHGSSDFLLYKVDGSGSKLWRRNLGGGGHEYLAEVQQTSDGGYIVAGDSGSYFHGMAGDSDFLIYKLNAAGVKIWRKNYGGFFPDGAESIQQTADGGYIVTGYTDSYNHTFPGLDTDFLVYKLDADGNKLWRKNYGGFADDAGRCIRQTSDGGYILLGNSKTYTHGMEDFLVYRLDAAGNKLWRKYFGGDSVEDALCVQPVYQ